LWYVCNVLVSSQPLPSTLHVSYAVEKLNEVNLRNSLPLEGRVYI
jgi:hypothetical protein